MNRLHLHPRAWGATLALSLLWGCAAAPSYQPMPTSHWQTISFDGSKIGHMQRQRTAHNNRVVTESWMRLKLQQPGTGISDSETHLRYEETRQGAPVSITKRLATDSANAEMRAEVNDGVLVVRQSKGDRPQTFTLPADFMLPEGRRLALLAQQGDQRQLSYSDWSFSEMRFERYQLLAERLGASGAASTDNPRWRLQRSRLDNAHSPASTLFSDAEFIVMNEYSQSAGKAFAMERCDQACALADFTPQTHVYRHLIRSPYRITENALAGTIRYQIHAPDSLRPPTTSEQTVTPIAGGWQIEVCEACGQEAPPEPSALGGFLQASYWLNPLDPALAAIAAPYRDSREYDVASVMTRLSRQVTRHMSEVADYAGYANAAEAWTNRTGDCTEHALVLASLGRAAGIPTRVALGLAYNNDRFLGRRFVFVPHMWVQAWTGTRWQSFDSALGDFNAGYITLDLSQGEASALIEMNAKLHQLKVISAMQVRKKAEEN
ncbi:transglutaminase domain-containing protein [Spongiibacter taiwanensis]|uniref:transglutaminase-like domain-containing protein n=1 Tax=Spongiibacter taiwanensis TaxID=1748242 RepID=UPI0020354319|nr:transglutaminase domain-containing protein [Spongiibacter taiwanensis]USA44469.1 transglutaminase domain-containing protein [Spongiibacter taiwanensis]